MRMINEMAIIAQSTATEPLSLHNVSKALHSSRENGSHYAIWPWLQG